MDAVLLLREMHHRVKNNLQIISSLLNLQAARQSEDVKLLFIETNARIRSIALVHEHLNLGDDFTALDLGRYLSALASGLQQTYGRHAAITVRAPASAILIDVAIPCGLIVNELVSNALKHAFPTERTGTICVALSEHADSFMLEVTDDGVGIPETVDTRRASTMGLLLMRTLAHQLGGDISFHCEGGTTARVVFPKTR
jgi:two-component sensor histidine kinase